MLVFEESRKPENQEKNVDRRNDKNQKQNQPTYDAESGNLALGGRGGGGGGRTPILNRRGYSSEILNLTPKGDHLGVGVA